MSLYTLGLNHTTAPLEVRERVTFGPDVLGEALRDLTAATRLLSGIETPQASRARARLASFAATIRLGQERFRDAIRLGLAAAESARATGEKTALAQALMAAGYAQMSLGTGGTERLVEALRIYEELGDLSGEAMVRSNIGACALVEGRWDEALSWLEGARVAELKAGNHVGAACAASNCGEIYAKQGRTDEAEPILREAIRVMRASGFHEGAAYAEIQLGRVLIERGTVDQAEALLERAGGELARLGRKSSELEAALVLSLAKVRLGRPREALELIERTAADAGDASGWLLPQAAESRALALAALGETDAASTEINAGLAIARKLGLLYEEGRLMRARAEIRRAAGLEPDLSSATGSTE